MTAISGATNIASSLGTAVVGAVNYARGAEKSGQEESLKYSAYTGNSISSDNY
jgi:hypothetical protein